MHAWKCNELVFLLRAPSLSPKSLVQHMRRRSPARSCTCSEDSELAQGDVDSEQIWPPRPSRPARSYLPPSTHTLTPPWPPWCLLATLIVGSVVLTAIKVRFRQQKSVLGEFFIPLLLNMLQTRRVVKSFQCCKPWWCLTFTPQQKSELSHCGSALLNNMFIQNMTLITQSLWPFLCMAVNYFCRLAP